LIHFELASEIAPLSKHGQRACVNRWGTCGLQTTTFRNQAVLTQGSSETFAQHHVACVRFQRSPESSIYPTCCNCSSAAVGFDVASGHSTQYPIARLGLTAPRQNMLFAGLLQRFWVEELLNIPWSSASRPVETLERWTKTVTLCGCAQLFCQNTGLLKAVLFRRFAPCAHALKSFKFSLMLKKLSIFLNIYSEKCVRENCHLFKNDFG